MNDQKAKEEIDARRNAHVAGLNAGNADAWIDCFGLDAVQMPPNLPANAGIDAIRQWSRGFLAAFSVEFSLSDLEVELAGPEVAFETGAYEIKFAPKDGAFPPQRDVGKYVTVYRRGEAGWEMVRDIWNSDLPLPVA